MLSGGMGARKGMTWYVIGGRRASKWIPWYVIGGRRARKGIPWYVIWWHGGLGKGYLGMLSGGMGAR